MERRRNVEKEKRWGKTMTVMGSVRVGLVIALFGNDHDVEYPKTLLKIFGAG